MTIVKKESDNSYKMIDSQNQSYTNLMDYIQKNEVNRYGLLYSVSLYEIDDPYMKMKKIKMKTMNKTQKNKKTASQREEERNDRSLIAERNRMFSDIKNTFTKKTKKQLVKMRRTEMINDKRKLILVGKKTKSNYKFMKNKEKRQLDFEKNRKQNFTFSPPLTGTVPINLSHKVLLDNPEPK
jgi:hypothetical protein